MEDINAKRNARRKRILENSEKRLLKITGRDEDNESEGKYNSAEDTENESLHSNMNNKISQGIDDSSNWNHGTKSSSLLLLINPVNYILLAFIVNILLVLQMDHLFAKKIAIPYFPIMLGRLYNYKNTKEMQENNNLLYAALILCNIKPELTYQLKKLITISHMIIGDLALYIFSFTLIYYGFFCLYSTDSAATLTVT
ncbi:hypothetical protein WN51_08048 [Melipona quadrifasciata]|uniref:Uncharacterized protein n=1 Tax=Melipona quadrifasciata TaxID=166423 RepID=A0A0M8ZQV4_9HYME|nr:hypothetical protein WN51_08048 [Melipona quadrifasciata]